MERDESSKNAPYIDDVDNARIVEEGIEVVQNDDGDLYDVRFDDVDDRFYFVKRDLGPVCIDDPEERTQHCQCGNDMYHIKWTYEAEVWAVCTDCGRPTGTVGDGLERQARWLENRRDEADG